MIDSPHLIETQSFQEAWIVAARHLHQHRWSVRNLIIHILDPVAFNQSIHDRVTAFANNVKVLGPKHVAYTIFPHCLRARCGTSKELYEKYNRTNGLCKRLVRRSHNRWGTYFQRLTAYETSDGLVNQLDNIITAIRKDSSTYTAAFAMVIQKPGGETTRRLGGPCLNYMAVQLDAGPPRTLGLLCTYRNHEFLERAYGNYWGLCNLLKYMADETGTQPGPLTCISSQAFVVGHKAPLKKLLDSLP